MRYTELIINDKVKLRLRMTLETMVMLERRLGISPLKLLASMGELNNQNWPTEVVLTILDYTILEPHTTEDVETFKELFVDEGKCDGDLIAVIIQLIKDSGFLGKAKQQEDVIQEDIEEQEEAKEFNSFEEYIVDFLEQCMAIGITEDIFWSSNHGEINRMIKSIQEIETRNNRNHAGFDYTLAGLINRSIGGMFSKSSEKYPSLEETYPLLFDNDNISKSEELSQDELKVLEMKARMLEYARQNNAKREIARLEAERKKEKEEAENNKE